LAKKVTSIKLDETIHDKAKIEAIRRKITLAELIEDALRKELK